MRWLALFIIAACGRLGFDPSLHGNDGGIADGGPADANSVAPNLVFVTSSTFTGAIGGVAAADQQCTNLANAAGRSGNFIAWLSATGLAARDRLAPASGWVRADGLPVTTNVTEWLDSFTMFNPISIDEHGDAVAVSAPVWTGTRVDGTGPLLDCQDWSTSLNNQNGGAGNAWAAVGDLSTYSLPSCRQLARLFCFEVDRMATVGPAPTAGRLAFVTGAKRNSVTGLAGLDQMCQTEANTAGLGKTFLAAVATTTISIKSRFTLDTRPWIRVDGTVIASTGDALFSGAPLQSFINQDATGHYQTAVSFIWTGATNPGSVGTATCTDWTSVAASVTGDTGRAGDADPVVLWNQGTPGGCNQPGGAVLCLEQ